MPLTIPAIATTFTLLLSLPIARAELGQEPPTPAEQEAARAHWIEAVQEARQEANRLASANELQEFLNAGPDYRINPTWERSVIEAAVDRRRAVADFLDFAAELQKVYDLSRVAVRDRRFQSELRRGSKDAAQAAHKVLDFVNRGSGAPRGDRVAIPEEDFDGRMTRLVELFYGTLDATRELVSSDVLNVQRFLQVRSDYETMEALLLALPESTFSSPAPVQ